MAKQKKPVVVAELGRPETPAETAARKARDSKLYRSRKTLNNLVLSLLVSLGLVAVIFLMVPRGTGDYLERNVDVAQLAKASTDTAGIPLASPQLPQGWLAKQAEMRFSQDEQVTYWYIGYTTPSNNYAAVMQGSVTEMDANEQVTKPAGVAWLKKQLEGKKATGETEFAGRQWQVYDHQKDNPDSSNVLLAYVTYYEHFTLVISGTATEAEIKELATQTVNSIPNQ